MNIVVFLRKSFSGILDTSEVDFLGPKLQALLDIAKMLSKLYQFPLNLIFFFSNVNYIPYSKTSMFINHQ